MIPTPKPPERPAPRLNKPGPVRQAHGRQEWSRAVTAFVHTQGQKHDQQGVFSQAHAAAGDEEEWRRAFDAAARIAEAPPPPDARGTAFLVRTVNPTDAQVRERFFPPARLPAF